MSNGRTYWWAKDAGWWRREWIVALGEEFHAAGPAVIDWLACEAKAQNDGGFVKAGLRTVARGCFVESVTVGHVLSRSVTLGLLEEYSEQQGRFTCRISGWQADQERAMAARRKAQNRVDTGDSTPLSRSVTKCPPTGQDSTEETTTSSLRSDAVEPDRLDAAKVLNRDAVEVFGYWQQRCGHPHAMFGSDRKRKVVARLKEKYDVAYIKRAIDGAAEAPYVDERGKRHDELELICRTGSKLEDFHGRAGTVEQDTPAAFAARLRARHGSA